ncbi:ImmA/IrrE family metallo-endopeptidase [Prevotella communis]|uniref:ImmA/IrrE family metallo-endopeptidase n=1 Tax=Prevotella communis TaxID=2913614 RepID=UPI001EDB4429|nr:ImmA/IrrE family metallo-endopeptidase [Prevotella communis]UKK56930.1 ImmA/IrrE family metallo-endopeptidase [Prevotella communis]
MGARGNRTVTTPTAYEEPVLLTGLKPLLDQAEANGCFNGDQLDIEKVVEYVSSTNPTEPLRLEYVVMEPATSGSLTYKEGVWVIKVNKQQNIRRQRFTIAHELGHYMMHRNKSESFTDEVFFRTEKKDIIEYRANEFASQLLMPDLRVRKAIADGERNLGKLAERFNVSSAAMKVKVQELGFKLKQNE